MLCCSIMMARTQIALDPEAHRQAKAKAAQLGISLAEYIRRLVEADQRGAPASAAVEEVFDLGDGGATDIARDEDRLLGEAVAGDPVRHGA